MKDKDIKRIVEEYLKRLKNGEKCFDKFFRASSGYIQYIAYKNLVDKSFVDDVVMNTYISVLRSISGLDENKNGYAWLCTIARNEAYKINSRENRPEISLSDWTDLVIDEQTDLEYLVGKYDVEKEIARLDDKDREIVELRIYGFMKYEDIAKQLKISVATVCNRLNASLKKIQNKLEKQ